MHAVETVASPLRGVSAQTNPENSGPHSVAALVGSHIHAADGDIGHVENLIVDDNKWDIRYMIVATGKWWPAKHVLLAPYAVRQVDWLARRVALNVTRDKVRSSPPWDPAAMIDQMSEHHLHAHYGWPGYGW
jgi:hypothetical protein